MKRYFMVILLAMSLTVPPLQARTNRKSQIWMSEKFSGKLTPQVAVFGQIEHRYSNDNDALAAQHSIIGMNYNVNKWFSITPFLRTVNYQSGKTGTKNDWYLEYRPSLDIGFKWTLFNFKFNLRHRIERRIYKSSDNAWRFRERIEIKTGPKWTRFQFQPYLADDIFYQKNKDGFYQNWFILGLDFTPIKPLTAGIFYMLQTDQTKDKTITQTDIWTAKFNFEL